MYALYNIYVCGVCGVCMYVLVPKTECQPFPFQSLSGKCREQCQKLIGVYRSKMKERFFLTIVGRGSIIIYV